MSRNIYMRPHVMLVCIANCDDPDKVLVKIRWEKSGVWHKCQQTYGNSPELMIGVDILSEILSLPPCKYKGKKFRYCSEEQAFYWKGQKLMRCSPELAFKIEHFILNAILQQI